MEVKTVQLRCQTCGGMMTVEDNNSVLSCPYCGSKELIRESDDVVIERIKNETYKDIELNKLQYEEQKEKRIEEKEMVQKFKKSGFSKVIIAAFIICLLVCFNSFSQVKIMPGIIALVQTALFALAWLMGMNIIKEKRPNVHIIFAVIGFVLIIPFFSANSKLPMKSQKYEWPETGISTVLPKPEAEKGNIVINSNESFYISLDDVTEKQYQNYLKECQERGFTVDSETNSYGYTAYNSDGYKLSLIYYNSLEELSIDLDAPIDMKELKWPNSETARLLPIPKSNIGHINWENSNGFFIYVGNTSKDDFDNYVDACKNKGFTVDYKSGDNYYRSNNADGYNLDLSYEGNDTMSIKIKAPDKAERETEATTLAETTVVADNSDEQQENEFDENSITETEVSISLSNGVTPELKAFLDEYEAFWDEYVAFYKSYMDSLSSGDYLSMLSSYADMLEELDEYEEKLDEMEKKLDEIDEDELSAEDYAYYLEVTTRIYLKMLEMYQ